MDRRASLEDFPEEEQEFRVVAAWIAYGIRDRIEAARREAELPLHVSSVWTGPVSAFVIGLESPAPPWLLLVPVYKGRVLDLICARGGVGRYTTIDGRRRPMADWGYWLRVVQRFLASRGVAPWPDLSQGTLES